LLAGRSQAIGKHLRDPMVSAGVAPEFAPKRNSELSVSRGLSADDVVPVEYREWEVPSDSEANSCFHCGASPMSAKMREPLQCGTGRSWVSRRAPLDRPTA
jgi:hypothetical protein